MKWISLISFFIQNSLSAIVFRYATTEAVASERATSSAILLVTEVSKMLMSAVLLLCEESFDLHRVAKVIKEGIIDDPRDTARLVVPTVIYAAQNALMQLSAGNVPASLWQVTYQAKALVVALFSVSLLGKRIKRSQWLAIFIMSCGIAGVQLSNAKESKQSEMGNASEQDLAKGLLMLSCACLCSGFASVFTEMVFKQVGTASKRKSVWLQNMQLAAMTSALLCFTFVQENLHRQLSADELALEARSWSPFRAFSMSTWILALNNAIGGLLVALVIKHADNILRSFASAFATVSVAVISTRSFGFDLRAGFVVGALMVLVSSLLYGGTVKLPGIYWNTEFAMCSRGKSFDDKLASG